MNPIRDVECEYLAKDHRSCSSVDEVTGKAGRDKGCSAEPKDLCCYLCRKRETCDISCSFLDETQTEDNTKRAEMRSVSSLDGEKSVLVCPFCGAPYRKLIPNGSVQVRCDYCGASVVVPPDLGAKEKCCPNHPSMLTAGICNLCGESFCENCLYSAKGGQQFLCPKCYEDYRSSTRTTLIAGVVMLAAISIGFSALFWIQLGTEYVARSGLLALTVIGFLILIGGMAAAQWLGRQKPVTLHDIRTMQASEDNDERM